MVRDKSRWAGFGPKLNAARRAAGLTLQEIGLRSISTLSRIENGHVAPDEAIVQRYAQLTGNPDILTEFRRIEHPSAADVQTNLGTPLSFNKLVQVTNLEVIVDVAETVLVFERRTMIAIQPSVQRARLLSVIHTESGTRPALLEAYAYGAEVVGSSWDDFDALAVDFEFPAPLLQNGPEYTFYLARRFDRLAPRFTQMAGYSIPRFRLMLSLPENNYKVFLIDGVPPQVAAPSIERALSGETTDLPSRILTDGRQISHTFENVRPALSHGFAWSPPNLRN